VVKKVGEAVKRDFFGRVLEVEGPRSMNGLRGDEGGKEESREARRKRVRTENGEGRVWVSFHEGYSNAVRKPVTIRELMGGL